MDLFEIFQGNSDKARLITTIIGVIIALSVVGVNQFFNSRRSRKDAYISKIEQLYETVLRSQRLLHEYHNTIVFEYGIEENTGQKFDKLHAEFFESIEQLRVITDLYFHGMDLNISKMRDCFLALTDSLTGCESINEYLSDYSNLKEEISSVYSDTRKKLRGLMNEYMH